MRLLARSTRSDLALDLLWFSVAAVVLLAITLQIDPAAGFPADETGAKALDTWGVGIVLLASAGVGLLRRWPLPGLAVITLALVLYTAGGYLGGPVYVTAGVGLYRVASTSSRRVAWTAAVVLISAVVGARLILGQFELDIHLLFIGWTFAAVFLGDAVRSRREHLAGVEARARESRDEEARRRVAEERLRIARDLHDGVAHSMATINVQSGVAAHVIDRQPDKAKEALDVIRRTSGDVLDELAALLKVLREDAELPVADVSPPTPNLSDLDDLVQSSRRAGLRVDVSIAGQPNGVPQPVGVAAYRIVQESLTNVLRHAERASVAVTVTYGARGSVTVDVADDGPGAATPGAPGTGVGIVGMRERAETTGGRLETGPMPGGGFRVRASWPERP